MLIYKATSKTSGKSYIGKTTNTLKQRVGEHIRKSKKSKHTNHFHNAIKKYGKDDFVWEILDTCDSEEELNIIFIGDSCSRTLNKIRSEKRTKSRFAVFFKNIRSKI